MQWTVDNLDSGGGLMTNKINFLRLRAMAMCLWVSTIPSLGHSWGGERGKFHWFERGWLYATQMNLYISGFSDGILFSYSMVYK